MMAALAAVAALVEAVAAAKEDTSNEMDQSRTVRLPSARLD